MKAPETLFSGAFFVVLKKTTKNTQKMKKIALLTIGFLLSTVFFVSCKQDLGDLNRATTIENIVGKWHVVRYEGDVNSEYQVEITENTGVDNGIIIHNFYNNGADAQATVKDMEITLPSQKLGTYTIKASGIISQDFQHIDWTITVDGEQVTATFTPGTVAKRLAK